MQTPTKIDDWMLLWKFDMQTIKKEKLSRVSYNSVDILPVLMVTFKSRKITWDPDIFYFSTSYLGKFCSMTFLNSPPSLSAQRSSINQKVPWNILSCAMSN